MPLFTESYMERFKQKRALNIKKRKEINRRTGIVSVDERGVLKREKVATVVKAEQTLEEKFGKCGDKGCDTKKGSGEGGSGTQSSGGGCGGSISTNDFKNGGVKGKKKVKAKKSIKVKTKEKEVKIKLKKPEPIHKVAMFVPFSKVDKVKKLVGGIATSEAVDSYGDIVRIEAIKKALPSYLEFGNIREMHMPSAVGTIKDHELNEKKKYLYIEVKVVDDSAWEKVLAGVYKGFSIGGNVIEAVPLTINVPKSMVNEQGEVDKKKFNDFTASNKKSEEEMIEVFTGGFDILNLELIEISLVDRPANPEALIDSFKSATQTFVPDRAIVMKAFKDLTKKKSCNSFKSSLQKKSNYYKTIENLSVKFSSMNEKQLKKKALGDLVDYFKDQNINFDSDQINKSANLSLKDIFAVINIAVEKTVAICKDEGIVDKADDEDDEESKEVDEEEKEDDEEKKEDNEDEEKDEEEKDEDEEKEDDDDDDDGENDDEEEEKEEEEKKEDEEPEGDKKLEAVLKSAIAPLVKQVEKVTKDLSKIKKAGKSKSAQSEEEIIEKKVSEPSFKGMFN